MMSNWGPKKRPFYLREFSSKGSQRECLASVLTVAVGTKYPALLSYLLLLRYTCFKEICTQCFKMQAFIGGKNIGEYNGYTGVSDTYFKALRPNDVGHLIQANFGNFDSSGYCAACSITKKYILK